MKVRAMLTAGMLVAFVLCGTSAGAARPAAVSNRLLVFGHSIAFGSGASTPAKSWASLVAAATCRALTNDAHKGDLSAETENVILQSGPYRPGDVAVIETGLNDVRLYGNDPDAVNRYWSHYSAMFWALRTPQGVPIPIIVVADPGMASTGWSKYTPFNRGSQAIDDQYVNEVKGVALNWKAATVVDVRAGWSDADIGPDALHPNDTGHAIIAAATTAAMKARSLSRCPA